MLRPGIQTLHGYDFLCFNLMNSPRTVAGNRVHHESELATNKFYSAAKTTFNCFFLTGAD